LALSTIAVTAGARKRAVMSATIIGTETGRTKYITRARIISPITIVEYFLTV
jgi:hypothetical protein